jgi:pantoate--beta-alanine ligase
VPTVREEDGLALSSRNAYLSPDERGRAVNLFRALRNARQAILAGQPVAAALGEGRDALLVAGFSRIDYFALVDRATLEPLDAPAAGARLIAAAAIGTTRLIDNLAL